MDTKQITPNVTLATFYPGVNVAWIRTERGAIAVDAPPQPSDARSWRESIVQQAGSIRYVILTDSHLDRLLGAGLLGAPVIAGLATLRRLQEGGEIFWRAAVEEWARRWPGVENLPSPRSFLPQISVNGSITLHESPPVVIESVRGATPGSVWARLPTQRVVLTGDTVVVGDHPLLSEAPDTAEWLRTLVELRRERFPADTVVPGRGAVGNKEITRDMSTYIQLIRRRVRSVHNANGSRGDLVGLVAELLAFFPVPPERREAVQRQVRADLERVFEELRVESEGPGGR